MFCCCFAIVSQTSELFHNHETKVKLQKHKLFSSQLMNNVIVVVQHKIFLTICNEVILILLIYSILCHVVSLTAVHRVNCSHKQFCLALGLLQNSVPYFIFPPNIFPGDNDGGEEYHSRQQERTRDPCTQSSV